MEILNEMEYLEKLTLIKQIEGDDYHFQFVDFVSSIDTENINYSNSPMSRDYNNICGVIGPKVVTQKGNLEEKIEDNDIRKELLWNINKLADDNNIKELPITEKDERLFLSKINSASNIIAAYGRIGLGNHIIMSEKNYSYIEKYKESFSKYTIIIEDIEDIIVYRVNEITQPGLLLMKNDDKYGIIKLGLFPEKQYFKIKVDIK